MRKAIVLFLCVCVLLFAGCAQWRNTVPPGKTIEANWAADERYCQIQSGKIPGLPGIIVGVATLDLYNVFSGNKARYSKCMEELGWMEYR
jgi:hypothetical protein